MRVICVTNRQLCRRDFLEQLQQIAMAKPDRIILREKDLSESAYQTLAEQVLVLCRKFQVPLICNSFYQVAERLSIPVQLPYPFLSVEKTLSVPFGVSIHTLEEAKQAEQAGAAFLIAGHLFPTACKLGIPPRGLSFLQEICQAVSIPVFGIGGIQIQNALSVKNAGAAGICLMSSLMQAERPEHLLQSFLET